MEHLQRPSPARATLFYTASILALSIVSPLLQAYFKLPGYVASQLLIMLGLPVLFSLFVGAPGGRRLFRVHMLSATGLIKSVLAGLLAWALAHSLNTLIIALITALGGKLPELYSLITQAPFPVALLAGALVPAICEETAFRGYLQWNLGRYGPAVAAVLTGILFGVMHMSIIRVFPLTLLGLVFSWGVQRTGSLLPGIIMHFVNNATTLILNFALNGGSTTAQPTVPSAGEIAVWLVAAAAISAMLWMLARSFGPADLAKPLSEEPQPGPETAKQRAERHLAAVTLPLLPALLIYVWAVVVELQTVF